MARRVAALKGRGLTPGLAVLLVGDDPASQVYVRHKVADCEQVGMRSILDRHPGSMSEAALLARIAQLNADPAVHGILVQLPLPAHVDAQRVIEAIAPAKDVDGFHVASAGALMIGRPGFKSCTPYGCMKMLESIGFDPKGRHAVVIGRSNIVGKPMAMMLLAASATVTVCHSATPDLARPHAPGRPGGGGRRPPQHPEGRHGQARRGHHRRRHESQRPRQALRRRRLRGRARGRHPGSRRCPVASAP